MLPFKVSSVCNPLGFGLQVRNFLRFWASSDKEVEGASEEAFKGFSDLRDTIVKQTRRLSLDEPEENHRSQSSDEDHKTTPTEIESVGERSRKKRIQSDVIRENDSLISKFRSEAAKRLKDVEKAEDAADEALLRFGTNIRNFLRDAVTIAPPSEEAGQSEHNGNVMFESKDSAGRRVIHTTRFDAQLHVIHSTFDSFTHDPISGKWPNFRKSFLVDKKTDDISNDLDQYPDLRRAMEQLVPEKVDYQEFWCRYYFLRFVIETEEQRRKELLRGATTQSHEDEEINWDADSDEEQDTDTRPTTAHRITLTSHKDTDSTTTISQQPQSAASTELDRPAEARKSNDQHSQPDSDASYDLVSGATSKTPGSPKEAKGKDKAVKKDDESDDEDWE